MNNKLLHFHIIGRSQYKINFYNCDEHLSIPKLHSCRSNPYGDVKNITMTCSGKRFQQVINFRVFLETRLNKYKI